MSVAADRTGSVLAIDDDEVTLRLLKVHLERQGYRVFLARTAAEGLRAARQAEPDLVLTDSLLPDGDGLGVCRCLAADSRTRHIPVILMAGGPAGRGVAAALLGGADDVVVKPLDYRELAARIHAHIRRSRLKPILNPLTGLPGNLTIEQEIRRITAPGFGPFAVLYTDLNHFKAYNDVYGFPAGDDAIRLVAAVLKEATNELGNAADLVGHVGGDDFVVVTTPDRGEALAERILAEFDRRMPQLYSPADRRRGYLTTKDRQGMIKKYPLLSIAIAMVHNLYHPIASHWEIGEIGAELKKIAKSRRGSACVKDQRRA